MVVPKFSCGDIVFHFEYGQLCKKEISKIRVDITEQDTFVRYGFKNDFGGINETLTNETEVFGSKEEFINKVTK